MPEVTMVPKDSLYDEVRGFFEEGDFYDWSNVPDAIPAVQDLDRELLTAIERGGGLEMGSWHKTCGTAHCIAGWAVTLAGEAGAALEDALDTDAAAHLIYAASGAYPPPNFYPMQYREPADDPTGFVPNAIVNERALAALRARVAAREAQP